MTVVSQRRGSALKVPWKRTSVVAPLGMLTEVVDDVKVTLGASRLTATATASAGPSLRSVKVAVPGTPGSMIPLPFPPASTRAPLRIRADGAPQGPETWVHSAPRPPVY